MVPVFINRNGGTAGRLGDKLRDEVQAAFASAGVAIDLHLLDGGDIAAAVRRHAGDKLVVVGGGDGTLGSAADVLASSGTALGILALGTHNHLARELGIPADLPAAAALIAQAPTRRIDLARVNGRAFVNNASIGLYPALVRRREAERDKYPVPKWLAAVPATVAVLRRMRHHRLRLSIPGQTKAVVTPLLFIGNNRYTLEAGSVGTREALDDGKLSVYAVGSHRRLALIGFALRTLAGRAGSSDFAALGDTPELTVAGSSRRIHIALDGEVTRLSMPLHFTSEPGALTVVAPLSEPDASPTSP